MRHIAAATAAVVLAACASTSSSDDASDALGPDDPVPSAEGDEASDLSAPTTTGPSTTGPSTTGHPASDGVTLTTCWSADPASGSASIGFVDITEASGLLEPLLGMHGHAAAWGDVDADGVPDLVVGTFADRPVEQYRSRGASGPSPDTLLVGGSTFDPAPGFPEIFGRTSGAVVVDLDGDGDQDVVLARNMRPKDRADAPTHVYRNDGESFSLVELDLGPGYGGRSVGVLDHDGDGDLDLLVLNDRFGQNASSVLLENTGDLTFRDATADAGLPADLHGLGLATSDIDGDGATDVFVAGSNRLFVSDDDGFVEVDRSVFEWEVFGDEDDVSSAAFADLDRDGRPDLVVGHHYNSTLDFEARVPVRIYLHRGLDGDGLPTFEDVTDRSGLPGLPTKAPHVEIADLDNDGWPDILTTASAADGRMPAVFRHRGLGEDGVPRFDAPLGLGDPQYWVSGPTADVDRDGRLDVFLLEWEPSLPSRLLRNTTSSGNWLSVDPAGDAIGTVVHVWEAGHLGDPDHLLGVREVVVSQGYAAGHLPQVHFGLGDTTAVDVAITAPDGTTIDAREVRANQHLTLDSCPS